MKVRDANGKVKKIVAVTPLYTKMVSFNETYGVLATSNPKDENLMPDGVAIAPSNNQPLFSAPCICYAGIKPEVVKQLLDSFVKTDTIDLAGLKVLKYKEYEEKKREGSLQDTDCIRIDSYSPYMNSSDTFCAGTNYFQENVLFPMSLPNNGNMGVPFGCNDEEDEDSDFSEYDEDIED